MHAFFTQARDATAVADGDTEKTVIFVPQGVPDDLGVAVSGDAVLDRVVTNPDGTRFLLVAPNGSRCGVALGAPADVAALRQRVAGEAPLVSIDTAQAQRVFDDFIATADASSDSNIASRAGLVSGIVASPLGNTK